MPPAVLVFLAECAVGFLDSGEEERAEQMVAYLLLVVDLLEEDIEVVCDVVDAVEEVVGEVEDDAVHELVQILVVLGHEQLG